MTNENEGARPAVFVLTAIILVLFGVLVYASVRASSGGGRPAVDHGEAVLLSVNDVYRIEGVDDGNGGGLARVRALRRELEREHPDLLIFLAGDFLFPSLLSSMYEGEQMVAGLNRLDGRRGFDPRFFVTFGNHEFDLSESKGGFSNLKARVFESEFTWLGSNVVFTGAIPDAPRGQGGGVRQSALVESGGLKVGIFSLTTDKKKAGYVARFLDPVDTALAMSRELRQQGADVVVALTHLTVGEDVAILEAGAEGPDLILGGHEHERLVREVDGRWVVKADAEVRTAAVVRVRRGQGGRPEIFPSYRFLDQKSGRDRRMERRVTRWLRRHDQRMCGEMRRWPGCLDLEIAKTDVRLDAEEQKIRLQETNFGNWVADVMLEASPEADVAFINGGALRLNQDLPPGPIRVRDLLELVAYPENRIVQIELSEVELQKVINRGLEEWTGAGHFLHVSGFRFRHGPKGDGSDDRVLTNFELLRKPDASEQPNGKLTVATLPYLARGGDGYACLEGKLQEDTVAEPKLPADDRPPLADWQQAAAIVDQCLRRDEEEATPEEDPPLLMALCLALRRAEEPIAPRIDGRICTGDQGDCAWAREGSELVITPESCREPVVAAAPTPPPPPSTPRPPRPSGPAGGS